MPAHSQDPMVEAHEDRLQRVEDSFSELSVFVAGQGSKLSYIQERMDDHHQQLLDRLAGISKTIQERLDEGAQQFTEIHQVQRGQAASLGTLTAESHRRAKRRAILKKLALGLGLGVVGVVGHKIAFGVLAVFHFLFG